MKKFPPLKSLPVFLSVCRNLSFSRAADELCVTRSAVSQSIKSLEDFFGKTLIERSTRSLKLTDAGERLFIAINEAFTLISKASERELKNELVVAINILPTLAVKWLIPKLPQFKTQQPNIELRLSTQSITSYTERLSLFNNIDLALAYGTTELHSEHNTSLIAKDCLVLVGSPIHADRDLKDILMKEPQIRVSDHLRDGDWHNWLRFTMPNFELPSNSIYFESSVQAIQAAIAGLGVFVTHKIFVTEEVNSGLLKILGGLKVKTEYGYYLIANNKSWGISDEVQRCAEWLKEQLRLDSES